MLRSRGFTLIEMMIALTVAMTVAVIYMSNIEDTIGERRSEITVRETLDLMQGVQRWFAQNDALPGGAGCGTAVDVLTASAGYVAIADGTNAFGNAVTTSCTATRFNIAQDVDPAWASYVAGFLPGAIVSGSTVTVGFAVGQAPAIVGDRLHRVAVPGRPELNELQQGADLNNHSILNAGSWTGGFSLLAQGGSRFAQSITVPGTLRVDPLVGTGALNVHGGDSVIGDLYTNRMTLPNCWGACPATWTAAVVSSGDLNFVGGDDLVVHNTATSLHTFMPRFYGTSGTVLDAGAGGVVTLYGRDKVVLTDGVKEVFPNELLSGPSNITYYDIPAGLTWVVIAHPTCANGAAYLNPTSPASFSRGAGSGAAVAADVLSYFSPAPANAWKVRSLVGARVETGCVMAVQ